MNNLSVNNLAKLNETFENDEFIVGHLNFDAINASYANLAEENSSFKWSGNDSNIGSFINVSPIIPSRSESIPHIKSILNNLGKITPNQDYTGLKLTEKQRSKGTQK